MIYVLTGLRSSPTKYFIAHEKNYINKMVSKITNDNGVSIANQEEIQSEIKSFYEAIYSNRDNDLNDVDK